MFFSKRILIWTVAALATTTVVVGTAVGVTISQNRNSELSSEEHNSLPIQPAVNETASTNATRIDLNALIKKINQQNIVIKKQQDQEDGMNQIMPSTLYAFNVDSTELSLSGVEGFDTTKVSATFALSQTKNTVANLNNGILSVSITLKEITSGVENNQTTTTIEINTFKKANPTTDFAGLLDANDGFVLNISPDMDNANKYIDLDSLNNQSVAITPMLRSSIRTANVMHNSSEVLVTRRDDEEGAVGSVSGERVEQDLLATTQPQVQQTTTALTKWLNLDSKKKNAASDVVVKGEVKLEKISGDGKDKVYFHLVSKDITNRIKLTKGDKEVLLSEIKTTNLLASDVTIKPTNIVKDKQEEYLKALMAIDNGTEGEQMNKKYLTDKADTSLERKLSVNLADNNKLFVKPYIINWPNDEAMMKVGLTITVSFGSNNNTTSFSTNDKDQLEQLKAAGFKFGLFTKKLTDTTEHINASIFDTKKSDLTMYFKMDNYTKPVTRPGSSGSSYPAGFMSKDVTTQNIATDLTLTVTSGSDPKMSENWLVFADYSYKGITSNMAIYTPSISLIRLDANTPVA